MTEDHILIEAYLDGSLSKDQQIHFDQRLKNASFRSRLLDAGVALDQLQQMKDEEFLQALKETKTTKTFSLKPWLGAAAIAGLLIAASMFFFGGPNTNLQQEAIAQHFIPYPPVDFSRGDMINPDEKLKSALRYYVNEDWPKAEETFRSLDPQTDTILMYVANCQLKQGNYRDAEKIFFNLTESMALNIRQNAEWYLFYSLLYRNNIKGARVLYGDITNDPKHPFLPKASQLKSYLEEK